MMRRTGIPGIGVLPEKTRRRSPGDNRDCQDCRDCRDCENAGTAGNAEGRPPPKVTALHRA